MNKWFAALLVVIGFVSLVGSAFFSYFLLNFSSFASQLQSNIQNIPALQGLSPVVLQNLTSTIQDVNNYVNVLWLWAITLFVSSLTAMYFGIKEFRNNKKK